MCCWFGNRLACERCGMKLDGLSVEDLMWLAALLLGFLLTGVVV